MKWGIWLILAGFLAFQSPALAAGWTALPITSNDWYSASGAAVMSQCWSGIVERMNICGMTTYTNPASDGTFNWVQTLTCSAGYSNSVTTNNGIVYTNTWSVSTNITTTNQFGPLLYSYTDVSGVHTSTAYPFVTSAELFKLCRFFYRQWGYPRGGNGASGGFVDENDTKAINRDVEVGGTFDNWFATADGTNYPQTLPYYTLASLMQHTGAGKSIEVTNNGFNLPVGGRGFFTQFPGGHPRLLAELHFTNAWTRVDNVTATMAALRQTNDVAYPVMTYVQGNTNVTMPSGVVISFTGEVVRGLSTINYNPPSDWLAADYYRTNVVGGKASGIMAGETVLNYQFSKIVNISCASTGVDIFGGMITNGDAIVIQWNSEPTQYMNYSYAQDTGLNTPNVDYRLWATYVNEVYSNLNALTWWGCEGVWVASNNPVDGCNSYVWTGEADTWGGAVAACEADTPTATSQAMGPQCYTAGQLEDDLFRAQAYSRCSFPAAGAWPHLSMTKLLARRAQFYEKAVAPTAVASVYDDTGFALTENTFCLWDRTGVWTNNTSITGAPLGQIAFPPEWCAEPATNNDTAKGWVTAADPQVVLEYDVEGGLQYTP